MNEGRTIPEPEQKPNKTGDFVPMIWLIEAMRYNRACTMNELIEHCEKFFTIGKIKFKGKSHISDLHKYIDEIKVKELKEIIKQSKL